MVFLNSYGDMLQAYPNIYKGFGNWINFYSAYKSSFFNNFGIYTILQFAPEDVYVINIDNTIVNLVKKVDDAFEKDSIDVNEPYSILNIRKELLYQVSNHEGLFGKNPYDKYLIQNSDSLGIYILEYMTYSGPKLKLILIDNLIDQFPSLDFDTSIQKQIDTSVDYKNKSSLYIFSDTSFEIYYLNKSIVSSMSTSIIENHSEVRVYKANSANALNFVPEDSGWLLIKKGESFINYLSITGSGLDRFINPFNDNIYYLFIGEEYNKSFLNRLKGITSFGNSTIQAKLNV